MSSRSCGALLAALVAFSSEAAAQTPAPSPPAPKNIEHGSGSGDGDSRGDGVGDGRGNKRALDHGSGDGAGDARGQGTGDGGGAREPVDVTPLPPPTPLVAAAPSSPLAIQLSPDFRFVPSVSYQARYYHREGNDFVSGGVTNFIRHRARLGASVHYKSLADVFIQLQDVRNFGEEADPAGDFSADQFDLHQGYLTFTPGKYTRIRLGRQEVDLANERLVGRPLFLEQSRSFDGLHFRYDKKVELEAGYFLVRDYAVGEVVDGLTNGKRHLGIAHLGYEIASPFHPHVVSVVDADTATERLVVTVGGIVDGKIGDRLTLSYSGEGYYQGGKDGDVNVSAWLAALTTRMTTPLFGAPYVEMLAVLVSGDDEPDDPTQNSFASPYPRGHRIHGEMDFFINFPRDTDARGLRDFGGKLGWAPMDVNLSAEFHFFDAMASRPDGLRHFGFESNFKVIYPFWEHARIDALYGLFLPGEIKRVGTIDPRVEHFVYTTARVGF